MSTLTLHTTGLPGGLLAVDLKSPDSTFTAKDLANRFHRLLESLKLDNRTSSPAFTMAVGSRLITSKDDNRPTEYFDIFGAHWFLRVWKPTDKDKFVESVFARNLDGTTICCRGLFRTVKDMALCIEERTHLPLKEQRLSYQSRPLSLDKLLSHYGIRNDSYIEISGALRGGYEPTGLGLSYVNVQNPVGPQRIAWTATGPTWMIAEPGLTLEGICNNRACAAYRQMVIINLGYEEYSPIDNLEKSKCPQCGHFVESKDCALNNCQYRFVGMKITDQVRRDIVRATSPWKAARWEDAYQAFRRSHMGIAQWERLVLQTRPLDDDRQPNDSFAFSVSLGSHSVCIIRKDEIHH
ncbi:hypothetical protein HKX48_007303 [Thoreauomyces humboldtii]|nr:hypothetical protein HKX48_007303 [Thoreauomyces humboldtii]